MVACTLPQLIAACHVLHRLHAPRHPPCALSSLTIKFAQRSSIELLEINYFLANHAQLTCACFPNIVVSESSLDYLFSCQTSISHAQWESYNYTLSTIFVNGLWIENLLSNDSGAMEARGFEPLTSGLQSPRSAKLSYAPFRDFKFSIRPNQNADLRCQL